MYMRLLQFLVFAFLLIAQVRSLAQVPTDYRFHKLNEENNLTNGVINSIAQDTLGFTWVGTEDGLFRFDGHQFTSFRSADNSGIPNNTVNKVFVDSKNQIWILTNYGLAQYDYVSDSIRSYLPNQIVETARIKTFTDIVESQWGDLFIGTSGGGVLRLSDGAFSPLLNDLPELAVSDIAALEISGQELWVATWTAGIYHFSIGREEISLINKIEINESVFVYDIKVNPLDSSLFVGSSQGLWRIRDESSQIELINDADDEILSLFLSENEIWYGTRSSGLVKLSYDFQVLRRFTPGVGLYKISHRTISEIKEDQAGNIWLGTHRNGINVFNPQGELMSIVSPNEEMDKYNALSVWGISKDDQDNIFLGTDGNGLFRFNLSKTKSELVASKEGPITIADNAILATLKDSKNRLWIGTYAGGLHVIERGRVRRVGQGILQSDDIRAIKEDKNGVIWVGTNRGGLYSLSAQGQLIFHEETAYLDIRSILVLPDYKDLIWLVTYGDGLVAYDQRSGHIESFDWNGETDYTPIGLDAVHYDDRIWIGTKQNGLVIFDPIVKSFERVDESKGLLNNSVRAVIPFGEYIWMSSNMGISAYQINTSGIYNFDTSNEFLAGQFNDGSVLVIKDQYLGFGNLKGLILFNPIELLGKRSPAPIVLTALSVDDQLVTKAATSDYLDQNIAIAKEINLGPSNNNFSLSFGTFNFLAADNWRYQYLLRGYDNDWRYASDRQQVTFREVPPGNYLFKARIVDFEGQPIGASRDIWVNISPPWYRTIYAYSAAAFLVIIILYLLYSYNYERANIRQSLLYEKKLRRQQEEVMQDKIRFYTNFSHEMRTPITLISGPTNDLLASDNISSQDKRSLKLIKRNANSLLKLINRLLEFRKIETENTSLSIGEYDLNILAQEEAESFAYIANERGIKFGFYSESNLKAWIDIEKVQIIINNLLSNALKYSKEGDKINFSVSQQENQFIIEVKDEGRGIAEVEWDKIFTPFYQAENSLETGGTGIGLALCKSLVDLHLGEIEVFSELGKGSVFKVYLKEGKAHFEGLVNVRFISPLQGERRDVEEIALIEDKEIEAIDNEKVLLIADDNVDIREYIVHHFNDTFKVVQASNGIEALDKAKELVPDMIISDIMMPEMDGVSLCKEIKSNLATSHIPVLLLTAKGGNKSKQEGYEVGADAYLTKPFDSGVLKARVKNLLESRNQLKELHQNGHWLESKEVPSREVDFIIKVEATILELVTRGNLNVVELCRELGFSRTSLYRKIKSLTGQSIKQFIRSIKLKKAAEMLASDDMSVSEVAFSLDFTDLKYFRSCFKTQHGLLPSEYRNKYKSEEIIDPEEIKRVLNI